MGRKKNPLNRFLNTKKLYRKTGSYPLAILAGGLVLTVLGALFTFFVVESREQKEFIFNSISIRDQVHEYLKDQALMLQAGMAFVSMNDTVTHVDWRNFISLTGIQKNMPEFQGMGYCIIIPQNKLEQHIRSIRDEGFTDYQIFPSGIREEYTSIIYVEPFTGRNRQAFGYDMFTNPVRRSAMEHARDYNVAYLTDRFRLTIDTDGEELYGALMLVPHYELDLPVENVEQRRAAIRGWLYSPIRIKTLMDNVLAYNLPDIEYRIRILDETMTDSTIMYDNYGINTNLHAWFYPRNINLPVDFNHNKWLMSFIQKRSFPVLSFIIFITGIIISILLYFLTKGFGEIEKRSQQIKLKNKQLRTLNATKDKFFSIIAHDLKSPYNAVLGFSDLLVTQVDKMERDEIVRIGALIHKSAGSAVSLLTNLMSWALSQTGRIKFSPAYLDAGQLVDEVISYLDDVAAGKDIQIEKNIPPGTIIYADREMIKTIFRNLLSNAIKFTNPGGKVTLAMELNFKECVFSVTDTGVGISEDNLQKLFRIDENFSTSGTEKEDGTGLGLIICKTFIDRHKGRIWAESRKGTDGEHGSTFWFSIPLPD